MNLENFAAIEGDPETIDLCTIPPLVAAAVEYAARGWRVFPVHSIVAGRCTCGAAKCKRVGKHPDARQAPNGCKDATTDPERVRAWSWRDRNIGIATGAGLVVIDVDPKNGAHLERTPESWTLIDGNGVLVDELPLSRVINTGSGGWHWYGTTATPVRNNAGTKLGEGIDVRGEGGYVVAPPSLHLSGKHYEVADDLPLVEIPPEVAELLAPRARAVSVPLPPAAPVAAPTSYGAKALRAECDRVQTAPPGAGHGTLHEAALKLGSLVAGGELDKATARAELLAADQGRYSESSGGRRPESESLRTIDDGMNTGMANPRRRKPRTKADVSALLEPAEDGSDGADGRVQRVQIYLSEAKRNGTLDRIAETLRGKIYLRDTLPVVLTELDQDEVDRGVSYSHGALITRTASTGTLRKHIDEKILFHRFDGRSGQWRETSCPKDYAGQIIEAAPEFKFDRVVGIIRTPLIDLQTGEITTARGYDKRSGYIIDTIDLPDIPEHPTKDECAAALNRLIHPFRGFLKRDTIDQVAIAAAALTAVLRPSMILAPCIVMDGTVPGCGKGLIARTLSAIAQGSPPATIDEGHDQAELEKVWAAVILSGTPVVLLDNVQRTLNSSKLESGLSEGRQSIRPMGQNRELVSVSWRALLMITANNASLRRDLLRRALPVRIIAKSENPEADRYDFDPTAEAMRDRAGLLAAAFTIARGWRHAAREQPKNFAPYLGGFEEWARVIGGAVKWLLAKSPVDLIAERKADDPSLATDRVVIAALRAEFGGRGFGTAEAHDAAAIPWAEAINGEVNAKRVGYWLRSRRDRIFENLILTSNRDSANRAAWRLIERPCPGDAEIPEMDPALRREPANHSADK